LSIPSVGDRIVQAAVRMVLEPILEADMLDGWFGFRPKRSRTMPCRCLSMSPGRGRRWVVETDIANCVGAMPHAGLMQASKERVGDRAVLDLVRGMLRVGVMEAGSLRHGGAGMPQGGVVTPPTQ
jgi:RNA-directed DNA polymerase